MALALRFVSLALLVNLAVGCEEKSADDTGTDTPAEETREGAYTGSLSLTVTARDGSVSDDCVGTVDLVFSLTASPQLSGQGSCTFQGALAAALPDTYTAVIDGNAEEGDALAGGVEIDLGGGNVIVDDWTGVFESDQRMTSSLDGELVYGGTTFDYVGGYDVSR